MPLVLRPASLGWRTAKHFYLCRTERRQSSSSSTDIIQSAMSEPTLTASFPCLLTMSYKKVEDPEAKNCFVKCTILSEGSEAHIESHAEFDGREDVIELVSQLIQPATGQDVEFNHMTVMVST